MASPKAASARPRARTDLKAVAAPYYKKFAETAVRLSREADALATTTDLYLRQHRRLALLGAFTAGVVIGLASRLGS